MTFEHEFVRRVTAMRIKALEEAILKVGLAGGGKVVEEHPSRDPTKITLILVVNGQPVPKLPVNRVEHLVPAIHHG